MRLKAKLAKLVPVSVTRLVLVPASCLYSPNLPAVLVNPIKIPLFVLDFPRPNINRLETAPAAQYIRHVNQQDVTGPNVCDFATLPLAIGILIEHLA
jgi:hypothetical protein